MKIALVGYGKMGKLIGELAEANGHEISHRISSGNASEIDKLSHTDVAIEFTSPESAVSNINRLLERGIPVVTGTTGWYKEFEKVNEKVKEVNGRFFYAANFSVGVHITMAVSNFLARLMERFDYQASIEEWHHTSKKDAPSGTAIRFAEGIIASHKNYNGYELEPQKVKRNILPIKAHREGDIHGIHAIQYNGKDDKVELKHEAFNRNDFALGALKAAQFLRQQPSGTYTMKDLINLSA